MSSLHRLALGILIFLLIPAHAQPGHAEPGDALYTFPTDPKLASNSISSIQCLSETPTELQFQITDIADCYTALNAIPQGLLVLDYSNADSLAQTSVPYTYLTRQSAKRTRNSETQVANVYLAPSARGRKFVIPAAIRHGSCLILIEPDHTPLPRPGETNMKPSHRPDAAWTMYAGIFPLARKLVQAILTRCPFVINPSINVGWGTMRMPVGPEGLEGHGPGNIAKYNITITGLPVFKGFTKARNGRLLFSKFPEEGWKIVLSISKLRRSYGRIGVDMWSYNLYEAEGQWSGAATKGTWWSAIPWHAEWCH